MTQAATTSPDPTATALTDVEPEQKLNDAADVPATDHAEPQAVTVIEPRPGWRAIDLAELWRYRELVYFLIWRDVKIRYKQTVMGAAWAIVQPLMSSLVFVLLFGVMGQMKDETTVPYFALVFAGQLPWHFFSTAVTQGGQSLVSSANLISKVYFPRMIVPMAAVGAGLVSFAISLVVMFAILAAYALVPPMQIVLLPLMLLGVVMTALGVGSLLSALTVAYRDFRHIVPFLVQMWMFSTPVAYPLSQIEGRLIDYLGISHNWMPVYFFLNPMAGFVQGFRWCLLDEPLPLGGFACSLCSSVILLVIGTLYFRRVERRFADIV